jgi:hypothetical protein
MKKKRIEEVLVWFKIKVDNEKEGTELINKILDFINKQPEVISRRLYDRVAIQE